jgi:hypothetical protein
VFGHKHYVPILKAKAGERWAIDRLSLATRKDLTPLFEIHAHKNKGDVEHAEEVCDAMSSVWGTASRFFLDTVWLHDPTGDSVVVEGTFDYARSIGLLAVPVVRLTYDAATLDIIRDIMDQDDRGCMLRLPVRDLTGADAAINGVVQYLQTTPAQIDLLVDYRHHPMDLPTDVPAVPTINAWRTFTAASGSCPRSLVGLPLNVWQPLQRHDWITWLAGVTGGGLARRPAFGDYTMRDPGPPAGGGNPPVSIKYTTASNWMARLGRRFQAGFSGDMFAICADLVTRADYSGPAFSVGDHTINEVAQQNDGPGNPQHWLQWGMNHHMTFVVDQIRHHPGL